MSVNHFAFYCVLFCLFSCGQKINPIFDEVKWDKSSVYIAYRGTNTKQGFLARKFNTSDTLSSHVGIMVFYENQWKIYNVADFKDERSDFKGQLFNEFYNLKEEYIFYASIWKVSLTKPELEVLLEEIRRTQSQRISFDKAIDLSNGENKLYCSEFVVNVLKKVNLSKFNIKPRKKKLFGAYKTYFRKDTLEYYPPDIFQSNPYTKKVNEWHLK